MLHGVLQLLCIKTTWAVLIQRTNILLCPARFCFAISLRTGWSWTCILHAYKHCVLKFSERNSYELSCLSILSVPTLRTKLSKLAIASLFNLSKTESINFFYWSANTKEIKNLVCESTLNGLSGLCYFLRSHFFYPVFLCLGFCHYWYWWLCDPRQCTHTATFPSSATGQIFWK